MKICLLVASNMIGGGVRVMVHLASALAKKHEVTLMHPIVPYYTVLHRLRKTSILAKARHIVREGLIYKWRLFYQEELDKKVRLKRYFLLLPEHDLKQYDAIIYPSVWHYHELKDLRLNDVLRIHWVLADHLFCSSTDGQVNNILEAYSSEDYLMATSQYIRSNFQAYGFKVQGVIHCGIDSIFVARERKWNDDNPTVLGYFQPAWWVKGAATLVQCLRLLRLKYPEVRIELFGHQKSAIGGTGSSICDRFHTGLSRKQVAELYRQHDIFIYPSYSDGFQAPPLEAMASGCAVVATRVGAVQEYAIHDRNALLCHPMDYQDMFRKVEQLILDRSFRKRLSQNAIKDMSQQWTFENTAVCFDNFLESVREKAGPRSTVV